MLQNLVSTLVDFCRRNALAVTLIGLLAAVGSGYYTAANFKMNTDVNSLLADGLSWRQTEKEIEKAFPKREDLLVIVVDGTSGAKADAAAEKLAATLAQRTDMFHFVKRPDALNIFQQSGLLYLSVDELITVTTQMAQAQALLGTLAADPSLRGLFTTLGLFADGIREGEITGSEIEGSIRQFIAAINNVLNDQPADLDWQNLLGEPDAEMKQTRKFVLTQPVLDFSELSPGRAATKAVRQIAADLGLTAENGVTVRMTGSVALNDDEFSSIAEGMGIAGIASLVLVILFLFLALRSFKIIVPIFVTLVAGLCFTTAFALLTIGSLNLISVAFAVMFVGIAVDFGIQFGVRFRGIRHDMPDFPKAMHETARTIAAPLVLAATTTAAGFLCFTPTDYKGVAELGLIAGGGMLIAGFCNLTLLPALIRLFNPGPEKEAVGFKWAASLDHVVLKRRKIILVLLGIILITSVILSFRVRFDFDPLNLKNPEAESVATLMDLIDNPSTNPYQIEILAKDLAEADAIAARIKAVVPTKRTMTLNSFVPEQQDEKMSIIADTAMVLLPGLQPATMKPAPTPGDILEALRLTARKMEMISQSFPPAMELLKELRLIEVRMQGQDADVFMNRLTVSLLGGFPSQLKQIVQLLDPKPITFDDLPQELRDEWVAADGRARIEIHPEGNPRDPTVLASFSDAVRMVEPNASGMMISILESGRTIIHAFLIAAGLALAAISLMLFTALRRVDDVLATLAPLLMASALTLATCYAFQIPINFANIIGLPLLLGLGVSYSIYFVTYWRSGQGNPLQSSMARAVLFSAATTLVAFGSLSMSAHLGTSSMGKILTIALIYCVLSTWILLPALLGRPPASSISR